MGVSPGRPINPYTGQVGGYSNPGPGVGYPGHVPFRMVPGTVDTGNAERTCPHCRQSAITRGKAPTRPYCTSVGTCYNGCKPNQQPTYQNSAIYANGYQNYQIHSNSYTYQQPGNAGINNSGFSMSGATGYLKPQPPSVPYSVPSPPTYVGPPESYDDPPPPYPGPPELETKTSGLYDN
ncbi:homeobox protein Hox-A3-like [Mya arenaria]|uniref:homeobox protein Hox-A3-like n=1 Tax=Mya arenaria TaxID=6604 RepID=UPI0022E7332C|nr:homeobox protein Hox-A3-like [Mya arenaria]